MLCDISFEISFDLTLNSQKPKSHYSFSTKITGNINYVVLYTYLYLLDKYITIII